MNNKELDRLFKSKMSDHQSDPSASDWESFSKILRKSQGFETVDFDDALRKKVKKHQTAFNENHWLLLKKRLEKEDALKKKIFSVKSLELIALFLLFWVYQTYELSDHSIPEVTMASAAQIKSAAHANHSTEKFNKASAYSAFLDDFSAVNNDEIAADSHDTAILKETKNYQIQNEADTHVLLASLPVAAIKPLKIDSKLPELRINTIKPSSRSAIKKYIMPVLSAGIGITQSGFDPIYNLKSYSTYSSQLAGGVLFSFFKNDLETVSGIKYTRRTHQPSAIVETYSDFLNNYYEISLDKISYDIVEIPLGLKYHFGKTKNISWYVRTGLSANFTMANHYTITHKSAGPSPLAPITPDILAEKDNKGFSSRLSEKEFNKGIFQGGNLAENWFLTVSGEVGLERRLSENHSLTIGAEYSKFYMIDGIGPNKDKLNGFAINFGLKHLLN